MTQCVKNSKKNLRLDKESPGPRRKGANSILFSVLVEQLGCRLYLSQHAPNHRKGSDLGVLHCFEFHYFSVD